MKVVILCGGLGTRLSEETILKPKPMVKIGKDPIVVHIMNIYKYYGYNDFILALGYKGESIRKYFKQKKYDLKIKLVDTGKKNLNRRKSFKVKKVFQKKRELYVNLR